MRIFFLCYRFACLHSLCRFVLSWMLSSLSLICMSMWHHFMNPWQYIVSLGGCIVSLYGWCCVFMLPRASLCRRIKLLCRHVASLGGCFVCLHGHIFAVLPCLLVVTCVPLSSLCVSRWLLWIFSWSLNICEVDFISMLSLVSLCHYSKHLCGNFPSFRLICVHFVVIFVSL